MIVIIGTTHHNTLSLVRNFGRIGEKVDVILHDGVQDSYVSKSKYVNKSFIVSDENEAYDCLLNNYPCATVFASSDSIASMMDRNYDMLKNRYSFFNCGEQGLLTKYMDKELQSELAKTAGFKVPVSNTITVDDRIPDALEYPCILKPLESINGGKKIILCYNEHELLKALESFDRNIEVLCQEYIDKDYEIVLSGVRVNGKIIIPGYVHKLRDRLGGTTYSTIHPISELPEYVIQTSKRLVESMNYDGLFGIELLLKDDNYYFVEINLRNDATTYALTIAGCNLPEIYYNVSRGCDVTGLIKPIRMIYSMVEYPDVLFALKGQVSILKWIKQRNQCQCLYFRDKEDMKPYRYARSVVAKEMIKRVFKHTKSR